MNTVERILAKGEVVAPVDVPVQVGALDPRRLEDWRRPRTPCLEKVIDGNLPRLSRLPRIRRFRAHDLNLKQSSTACMHWGQGPRLENLGDTGLSPELQNARTKERKN